MNSPEEKVAILYVDDEPNNLHSFRALLRMEYKVYTAQATTAAYEILANNPNIHVIISDQNMPGETGVSFLERVAADFPLPVRMLLTGYSDLEAVVNAINKGRIFRYITKPWGEGVELKTAITEAYRYYQTNSLLKQRNDELQQAYEELDRFSYSVTHDIRGPIVSALSALDVLHNIDDIREIRRFLHMLEKSMHRLNAFIMNTHSYHRISRGELDLSPVDFHTLSAGLKEVFEVEEKVTDTRFTVHIDQQGPFISDEILISVVINNLISNAFKYARKEGERIITMTITVKDRQAVIEVEDNGIGIRADQTERIFDLFYRSKEVRMSMGSGFGLYNVSRAVQKLGGSIKVDSTPGVGSKFTVNLDSL